MEFYLQGLLPKILAIYTIKPFIKYGWYKKARRKKKLPGPSFGI